MDTKNSADIMASQDTPTIDALRKSLETDRRQLTKLIDRIARQEAELAALLSGPTADDAGAASANPTKKRRHEETEAADATTSKLKMATGSREDPVAQVMADPMLLGSSILPCLSGVELSRSAEVSTPWKRTVTGPESDRLWKALATKEWPDMVKSLIGAGALSGTTFRDFYLRRKRPATVKPRSLDSDDELFILVDMPNLVKAKNDGIECIMPLQPLHRMFPLASCFRKVGSNHQNTHEETACSCASGGLLSRDYSKCSHPSGWLTLPFGQEVFVANPDTMCESSREEDVFQLNISILRKSDGKAIKVLQSSFPRSVRLKLQMNSVRRGSCTNKSVGNRLIIRPTRTYDQQLLLTQIICAARTLTFMEQNRIRETWHFPLNTFFLVLKLKTQIMTTLAWFQSNRLINLICFLT